MSVSGRTSILSTEMDPQDPRLDTARWLMLFTIDPLGECSCGSGTVRGEHQGGAWGYKVEDHTSPGKHPWWTWKDQQPFGYRHGAADATTRTEAIEKFGPLGGSRRWGMTLADIVMIDIDSPQAMLAFYRICRTIPASKIMGIAKTPRGYHIYLDLPGWSQRAMNKAMKAWLSVNQTDWHPTDPDKISRSGLVIDVRTGNHRYTVWSGEGSRDRQFIPSKYFRAQLDDAGRGMPSWRLIRDAERAPWNLEMTAELSRWIESAGQDTATEYRPRVVLDGTPETKALAWKELERRCRELSRMGPESGRNNALNNISYWAGAQAVAAGWPKDTVQAKLQAAADSCGCPGAAATIRSGLESGSQRLKPGEK